VSNLYGFVLIDGITWADPNVENYLGELPLYTACKKGYFDVARNLLERGAGVDALNSSGYTSFQHACKEDALRAAKFLLKCGANIDINDKYNSKTALGEACSRKTLATVQFLVENGATITTDNVIAARCTTDNSATVTFLASVLACTKNETPTKLVLKRLETDKSLLPILLKRYAIQKNYEAEARLRQLVKQVPPHALLDNLKNNNVIDVTINFQI